MIPYRDREVKGAICLEFLTGEKLAGRLEVPSAMIVERLVVEVFRFVWWKPASESMGFPQQILASIMDAGTFADILLESKELVTEQELVDVQRLIAPEASERSGTDGWRLHSWVYPIVSSRCPRSRIKTKSSDHPVLN